MSLLADLEDAELMAGNQSLGIIMANRLATPEHLVDLGGVAGLDGVTIREDEVEIGALTTHRTLERHDELRELLPMVPESAEQIAGPSVRNRGTLGGSIAEADPAGNYPTALVALDATLDIASVDGERSVPARDYFIAYMFTDLREDELITGVRIPTAPFPPERSGMAFLVEKRAAQTFPTISAATAVRVDDPTAAEPVVEEARVALANVDDVPLRVEAAAEAVEGTTLTDESLSAAGEAAREAANPQGEMHADREYKLELTSEFTRRSLATSYRRAQESDRQ